MAIAQRSISPGKAEMVQAQAAEPFTPPTYTMKEIHDAIPSHCFRPSSITSLLYVLRDYLFVLILACLATQINSLPYPWLRHMSWITYTFCQGLIFTGLWELAHECGHGALSKKKWVNNTMGLVIHSCLLVPYHSWRFTHSQHHKATNNLDKDIAFVPQIKDDWVKAREAKNQVLEMIEDCPTVALLTLLGHQVVAWPIYLTINNFALDRMRKFEWWKRSHFYLGGDGPNFKPENARDVAISDLGLILMATMLWAATRYFGGWNVMLYYGFPYMWTNHWILTITFLQHTDVSIPYYPTKTWSFLRGAASTVDRDFGFVGRVLFHGAIETHVVHHHASRIPFYHAAEASEACRKVMGTHYQADFQTPYLWALWKNYTKCRYVEETETNSSIYFFAKAV